MQVVVLAAIATIVALANLADVASKPLEGDSAMYGTIAKTIAATGEWRRLTFNGEPYFNKPPLHFWSNALVLLLLPPTGVSVALVPSLLGVVDTLVLYALCRATLVGSETAFFAGLVFLTTPEVVHWGRGVRLETLLTLWMLLGLWAAYRSVARPSAVLWLGMAAAGGWLTKGPQGLLPLAVAPVLWFRAGVLWARLGSRWMLGALGVCLGVIVAWAVLRSVEPGFVRTYFGSQVMEVLLVGGWFERGPFWYVGKLLRTYWPWLPLAGGGLVLLWRQRDERLGAWLWIACTVVIFFVISAAAVKKGRYLFQLYPALAVAAGVALAALTRRVPRLPTIVAAGAFAGAAVVLVFAGSGSVRPHVPDALATARMLDPAATVLLSHDAQHGRPDVGKILGFHAPVLLATCRADCVAETAARAGLTQIVVRRQEAPGVAAAVRGVIVHRNDTLAIVGVDVPGEGVRQR